MNIRQLISNEGNIIEMTSMKGVFNASLSYTLSIFTRDLKDIFIGWFTLLLIIVFASVSFIIFQNSKSTVYLGALSSEGDMDIIVRS